MHIWYDVKNKDTYQKKLHQAILISILIPIVLVFLLSFLLLFNQGAPLNNHSSLHVLSVLLFILFFVGVGIFSGIRSIKSNILKFIFVRTIHNKLLVLHIQEAGFTNLFGKTFLNSRVDHGIVSQIRGAVQNLQNIDTTQQILDSLGNLHILYITYQAKRGDRHFTTSINIPKSYPEIDQLLYIFRQKAN